MIKMISILTFGILLLCFMFMLAFATVATSCEEYDPLTSPYGPYGQRIDTITAVR